MSSTVKCSRCETDTGKPCDGDDHIAIPVVVDINSPGRRDVGRFELPIHLCLACQKSMREWWDAGKQGETKA
jgi:hypothetical protein